ncbi:uncharacterized protein LOC142357726 [Convolutriloba macropyga]|uniref:uncharacterized protein LOC142357726 n=1 Tax=Convolutriloba macropyga TaxID=536237 RepID=UPI003F51D70E
MATESFRKVEEGMCPRQPQCRRREMIGLRPRTGYSYCSSTAVRVHGKAMHVHNQHEDEPFTTSTCGIATHSASQLHTKLAPAERPKRKLSRPGLLFRFGAVIALGFVAVNLGVIKLSGRESPTGASDSKSRVDQGRVCESKWHDAVRELLAGLEQRSVTEAALFRVPTEMGSRDSLTLFQVRGNRLYCVPVPGAAPDRMSIHRISALVGLLQGALQRFTVPDVAFWAHMSDHPQLKASPGEPPADAAGPLLSIAGMEGFHDIPAVPFFGIFQDKISKVEGRFFAARRKEVPRHADRWANKSDSIYFSGSPSSEHRLDLLARFKASADLAGMSDKVKEVRICQAKGPIEPVNAQLRAKGCPGFCTKRCPSHEQHARELSSAKFALDLPGTGPWSRRLSTILKSGTIPLVFNGTAPQFYSHALKEGRHFLSVGSGAADALAALQGGLTTHGNARLRRISAAAEDFGSRCLVRGPVLHFLALFLSELSTRLAFEPSVALQSAIRRFIPPYNAFEWERRLWVRRCYPPPDKRPDGGRLSTIGQT